MHPQSPTDNAPCALAMDPGVHDEVAANEPPVPATELAIREQDRLMPIANVVRIMRRVLPPHAKISDEAKEVIQECVSEFISFVTGEANDRCHGEHRKTVTAEDIVWAMERLGFDDYVAPVTAYLQRMRDCEGTPGGRGFGRGQPRPPRAPAPAQSVPVAAFHGVHMQPGAAFPQPFLGHGYVMPPLQAPFSDAPHFGGQNSMLGGRRQMTDYYGRAAFAAHGNNGGGYHEEASSSNEEPPATGAAPRPQYPN